MKKNIGWRKLALGSVVLVIYGMLTACGGGGGSSGSGSGATGWTKQIGVSGKYTVGYEVAVDAVGNVYVAGETNGGLDGNPPTGNSDMFVIKYDNSGAKQYARQLGVAGNVSVASSVATDANGNMFVTGNTSAGLGGGTKVGASDAFLVKYSGSGVKQYALQFGAASKHTIGESVATDANGNVYVAGYTQGGLDGNTVTGNIDFFLAKYDGSGVKQYIRQMGVAGKGTYGNSVATDASGNVYVAGYTEGGLDGQTLTGITDLFVTKFNSGGIKQWTKLLGVAGGSATGYSVAADASGNVYVAGQTNGGLDGQTLTGLNDFFVTKFNGSGVKQWTRLRGAAGKHASANSVSIDASGNVVVAGGTGGGLSGGAATGNHDFFVAKYNSSGVAQYTQQYGVAGATTNATSVATDASGNAYVTGPTGGGLDGNTLIGSTDTFLAKFDSAGVKQ